MNKRQAYAKKYWQRPEVKAKKADEQAIKYYTEKGQDYEHDRRRTPKSRWMRARCNARTRKKVFTLTLEEYVILIDAPCKYCGRDISRDTGVGLDRIDNDKGYITGNCNPCCGPCNRRRHRSMDADVFEKQTELNVGYKKIDKK
jgi:hypothetical protein